MTDPQTNAGLSATNEDAGSPYLRIVSIDPPPAATAPTPLPPAPTLVLPPGPPTPPTRPTQPTAPTAPRRPTRQPHESQSVYDQALRTYNEAEARYQTALTTYHTEETQYQTDLQTYNQDMITYNANLSQYNSQVTAAQAAFDTQMAAYNVQEAQYNTQLAAYNKYQAYLANNYEASSYFRLGNYVAQDETQLLATFATTAATSATMNISSTSPALSSPPTGVTFQNPVGSLPSSDAKTASLPIGPLGVTVTSSAVTLEQSSDAQIYLTNSLASSAAKGQQTSAQLQGNTQSQNLWKAAVDPVNKRSPLDHGIFMFSDGDLQINTDGAAYMQFQQGHSTVVAGGDASYKVPNGQFTLSALNGISITAGILPSVQNQAAAPDGTGSGESNRTTTDGSYIVHSGKTETTTTGTAAGNAALQTELSKTTGMADLYLMASNNISQKAFGPLSEITYGDSYKNVQGNTVDIFSGTYYKETHGNLTQNLYAEQTNTNYGNISNTNWNNVDTVTYGGTSSVFFGGVFSFKLDVELNVLIGIQVNMLAAGKIDLNAVINFKAVPYDVSALGIATKFFYTMDYKAGPIDLKNVDLDAKVIQFEAKVVNMKMSKEDLTAKQNELNTKLHAMTSINTGVSGLITGLKSIL